MKFKICFIYLFIFFAIKSYPQKVTNVVAEQIGLSIQVSYNLETESTCNVSLF
jgi:hypothetical protein